MVWLHCAQVAVFGALALAAFRRLRRAGATGGGEQGGAAAAGGLS
jgi:hypothetical protein